MSLLHAVIRFPNSRGEFIGIRVTNFPALPTGSYVELKLGDITIEKAVIDHYVASGRLGTQINIEERDSKHGTYSKHWDKQWKKVSKICTKDTTRQGSDLIYPNIIDFSSKDPFH